MKKKKNISFIETKKEKKKIINKINVIKKVLLLSYCDFDIDILRSRRIQIYVICYSYTYIIYFFLAFIHLCMYIHARNTYP